jgi:HD-GYP domain-containing protein (c-di-GMP phosphodiesterase class II)
MAAVGWEMAITGRGKSLPLLIVAIVLLGLLLALHIHKYVSRINNRTNLLAQAAREAEAHYVEVLRTIIHVVEGRDKYSKGRSGRIGLVAQKIAEKLSLPPGQCELLNLAGQFHDIGLMAVPEVILNKHAKLGVAEFRAVQKHCDAGYEMLRPLASLAAILPAVRYHHERCNGTGYPQGLRVENIPIEARIMAVADSFDAMTHDRPHRAAMTPAEAMRELVRCSPEGYDPKCVQALADVVNLKDLQEIMPPPKTSETPSPAMAHFP